MITRGPMTEGWRPAVYDPVVGKWSATVPYDLRFLVAATGVETEVLGSVWATSVHDALKAVEADRGRVLPLDCHPAVPVR
jgi:hypothetical protein